MTDKTAAAGWQPIETAPKDGLPHVVNDQTGRSTVGWTTAFWHCDHRGAPMWVYVGSVLRECYPDGPKPTLYLPVPTLPESGE